MRIDIVAPFGNHGGWGRHSTCFADALAKRAEVRRFTLRGMPVDGNACTHGETTSPSASILIAPPSYRPVDRPEPQIFFTVWETSRLPRMYLSNLAATRDVWTPTAWGASVLTDSGIEPQRVHIVPEGVDAEFFFPDNNKRTSNRFDFLYVGKWEQRKGTRDLIKAFVKEFDDDPKVHLTLHFGHTTIHGRHIMNLLREELILLDSSGSNISISTRLEPIELRALFQRSDVFVLPTRAEAWGLPILEAMACGLPSIVTAYGGHLAFANETNSYLIANDGLEPAADPVFFPEHIDWGDWARPSVTSLQSLMRHCVERPDEVLEKGIVARQDAREKWTWDSAATIALKWLAVVLT